jgi:hypothetical protein
MGQCRALVFNRTNFVASVVTDPLIHSWPTYHTAYQYQLFVLISSLSSQFICHGKSHSSLIFKKCVTSKLTIQMEVFC